MADTDCELIARVLAGECEAYRLLVKRYQSAVVGVAYARTKNVEAARDCAQEAFTEAFTGLSSLRDSARFRHWLVKMAINKAISWVRRQRVERKERESRSQRTPTREDACPLRTAAEKEELARVQAALASLRDEDREIILLRYLGEKSRQETADLLRISPETADKRLQRAMERLRKML